MNSRLIVFFCAFAPRIAVGQPPPVPEPPGVVIDHSPASSQQYIGSPSIVIAPDGEYIASHDFFGPGSTRDKTVVFASRDRGATWERRATIDGQWWSGLFVHRGAVYLMGTTREYGFVAIRRSTDGGRTWTTPNDADSGLLHADGKYHTSATAVVVHAGRIWRAMEDAQGPGGWGSHFRAFMMSAPEDADLLKAESWTSSNRVERNPEWLDGKFGGWLEGNAVATRDGEVLDILRVDHPQYVERAAFIHISAEGKSASFDPTRDFMPFHGGAKKFTIRYDKESDRYWTLANWAQRPIGDIKPSLMRNTLALVCSHDLRYWDIRYVALYHPDAKHHAFQYVDWLIEGNDIIAVSRTAFDDDAGGAHRQHDANYLTFHRIPWFRILNLGGSPALWRVYMGPAGPKWGKLGHALGADLKIEGETGPLGGSAKGQIHYVRDLLVDTVNDVKLSNPISISVTNVALPPDARCVLKGYENGQMVGVPPAVQEAALERGEEHPGGQTPWGWLTHFVALSVVSPPDLRIGLPGPRRPPAPRASDSGSNPFTAPPQTRLDTGQDPGRN